MEGSSENYDAYDMYTSMVWFEEGCLVQYPGDARVLPYTRGMPLPENTRIIIGPIDEIPR